MIYELRTYTLKAGSIPAMLKANEDIGRPVRGDDYGKLEGYWKFDSLSLRNQVTNQLAIPTSSNTFFSNQYCNYYQ